MADTSLTIVLGGDVPLDEYTETMQRFRALIAALSDEVGHGESITWTVSNLESGSALTTITGKADRPEPVLRVVEAYSAVGRALERREPIPYSPKVGRHARELLSVVSGTVTSIRFETDSESSLITTSVPEEVQPPLAAFGIVEGRVGTLRRRPRVALTLYDSLNDRAIYCLLRSDQADQVKDTWDRRVLVEGRIKRDPETGRALEVSQVESIEILPEILPGSYRRARASAPVRGIAESPERTIRRLRDA